jgi:hypothetical protein
MPIISHATIKNNQIWNLKLKMADVLTPEQIQSNERFSAHLRADSEEEAERDSSEVWSVWMSIRSFILNINHRYTCFTRPIIEFEKNLHDLWYMVIVSASATPSNEAGKIGWWRRYSVRGKRGYSQGRQPEPLNSALFLEERSGRICRILSMISESIDMRRNLKWIQFAVKIQVAGWAVKPRGWKMIRNIGK